MCSIVNPTDCVLDAAEVVGGLALHNMALAVMEAYGKTMASLGTLWVNIGTPNLTGSGGGSSVTAGDAAPQAQLLTQVLGYVMWISLAVCVLSLMALGALIATRLRHGEGIAAVGRMGMVLGAVILISAASTLVGAVLPSRPQAAAGATLFLQSGLWWYMGAGAVVSVIIGGARMAWEQRAEPGRETIKAILTLVVVAGAGVTIVSMLVTAADRFSVWILDASLDCSVTSSTCFGANMIDLLWLGSTGTGALGALLIVIFGLIAIIASFIQIVLMVARGGMLVILTGILPLSASFTNTEMGKTWFKRCVAWLVAFILYKPAAAIVYATAFQLLGQDIFTGDGSGVLAVLTGLMLMILALFAMPALMRFVTPMVGALAGGAGGGMAAGAAMAALPSGAAAMGRMGSGSSGSGGASGPAGPSGASGSGGGSTSGGAGSSGGASGASSAATAGGASAGAGAAAGAGGGAAAGAAGGPIGVAAGAAVDVASKTGQAAAGAARNLGEQATGEAPDGSR